MPSRPRRPSREDQKAIQSPEVALAATDDEGAVAERSRTSFPSRSGAVHIFLTHERYELKFGFGRDPLARRSPNMTYHGGKIMPTVVSKAIFWGPSWANATFVGDKITGLDAWYTGHNGSNYAATVDEYTGTERARSATTTTHQGHVIDTSTAAGGGNTSTILAEVCKQIAAGNIVPDAGGNGYYPVYTDVPRGNAGYCAWHSAGTCGGTPVQFAFFFNLDGDAGCDPGDTSTGALAGPRRPRERHRARALRGAHRSRPARARGTTRAAPRTATSARGRSTCRSVTFPDGNQWKLQGEWSNAAYTAGTGYPNSSGQKGCLDGH